MFVDRPLIIFLWNIAKLGYPWIFTIKAITDFLFGFEQFDTIFFIVNSIILFFNSIFLVCFCFRSLYRSEVLSFTSWNYQSQRKRFMKSCRCFQSKLSNISTEIFIGGEHNSGKGNKVNIASFGLINYFQSKYNLKS